MASEEAPKTSKSYEGSCHCGAVKFTANISPPLEDQKVTCCNCSICNINGYLTIYPKDEEITFHSGKDELKEYKFGPGRIAHSFCPTCGTSVAAKSTDPNFFADQTALNVRTFKNVDVDQLQLNKFDGKKF
ncbi:MAG: hypothetical protein M1836_006579 [Candelina mexicana]|nr:MAG: hypothetical protein M1836_006579 [Candelina mexicana]